MSYWWKWWRLVYRHTTFQLKNWRWYTQKFYRICFIMVPTWTQQSTLPRYSIVRNWQRCLEIICWRWTNWRRSRPNILLLRNIMLLRRPLLLNNFMYFDEECRGNIILGIVLWLSPSWWVCCDLCWQSVTARCIKNSILLKVEVWILSGSGSFPIDGFFLILMLSSFYLYFWSTGYNHTSCLISSRLRRVNFGGSFTVIRYIQLLQSHHSSSFCYLRSSIMVKIL